MYITDYHKSFVLCYALHYYPFVEDHQVSIMAYQVRSLVNYASLAAVTPDTVVGRVGLEPTVYLT